MSKLGADAKLRVFNMSQLTNLGELHPLEVRGGAGPGAAAGCVGCGAARTRPPCWSRGWRMLVAEQGCGRTHASSVMQA